MNSRPATNLARTTEAAATVILLAATVGLFWIVPDNPLAHLLEPPYFAVSAFGLILVCLALLRPLGARGLRHERFLLTAFLIGMPLIYVAAVLLHGRSWPWLALEMGGLALYGAVAYWGAARAFRWLAIGIAAHALWDLAHYGRTDYIPDWYVIACVLVDTTLGFFVWSRLARHGDAGLAQGSRDAAAAVG